MESQQEEQILSIEARLSRTQGRLARNHVAQARVTEKEHGELEAAAKREGKSLAEWVRDLLLREARRAPDDDLFTELVATRMLLVNLIKPILLAKPVPETWITDAMDGVRGAKHKVAAELRKEYSARERKES